MWGKFRRLLAVFEYDAEDLSAFFDLWLDNHAGQYDLNWFISQPHPLSKERREEILCNQLSYLNALYAGRLHLDFNAVRQFQFSILIYAVEHRKKHFLNWWIRTVKCSCPWGDTLYCLSRAFVSTVTSIP